MGVGKDLNDNNGGGEVFRNQFKECLDASQAFKGINLSLASKYAFDLAYLALSFLQLQAASRIAIKASEMTKK